jgi:predicted enzyme related to lactoylglutathione lyase
VLVPSITRALKKIEQAGGKIVSGKEAYGE